MFLIKVIKLLIELIREFLKRVLQVEFIIKEVSVEAEQEVAYDLEDNEVERDNDAEIKVKILVKDWDGREKEVKMTLDANQIL